MSKLKRNTTWVRDARNPILPQQPGSDYDCGGCMNPWIMKEGDQYYLYYAGWGADRHRRVCLATAPAGQA
ncbi:MAG: 3-carboxymuconate cyclase, partial [Paenibacillus sp.]|nr:3-carboxymuconate cyclase [Paenibacillus sp.]